MAGVNTMIRVMPLPLSELFRAVWLETKSLLLWCFNPRLIGMASCFTSRMAVESRHSGYSRPNLLNVSKADFGCYCKKTQMRLYCYLGCIGQSRTIRR
ncbi:hypothetical protein CCUS01_14050 [Colletotrichum cuscutae]|uniref:Uncharacterized protein n=1 Tax=Colletotrichum cuscutae TaxID=1209917 RepID=A0AAI9YA27_9PEZI|nr:hypothetical protein CCUS01_14050 [Colletotrichum cuscutae]